MEKKRLAGSLLTGFLLVFTGAPALAWPADMHGSLVETAFLISPAAKARIPGLYLGDVIQAAKETREAGERAGECLPHRDAPQEAQRALEFLLKNPKWTHNSAVSVGRALHFVADSLVPDSIERGGHEVRRALFTGHDFVVFREARDDTASPISTSLRSRAKEIHFADDPNEDDALRYRAAVNAIADVLLRLPPVAGEPPAPDGGVGLFVVDTLDTGLGGMHVVKEDKKVVGARVDSFGDLWITTETTLWYDPEKSWGGKRRTISIDAEGIHVMDRANRRVGDEIVSRMAIFNNTTLCGVQLALSAGKWKLDVPLDIPPHGIRVIDVRIPLQVALGRMTSQFSVSELCRTKPAVFQLTSYAKVSGTNAEAPIIQEATRHAFAATMKEKRPFGL
ncbi:MAG: hypothetical protein ABI768_02095 [Acidobacteriota bacterium]